MIGLSLFTLSIIVTLSHVGAGERFYTFKPKDIHGNPTDFDQYRDKIVLVVNVASQCGYTDSNYKELSRLYEQYNREGFEILAFPCNQFGKQEPWPEPEINRWVHDNYKVDFKLMHKVDVKGPHTHPLFEYLKGEKTGEINWNFDGKYLIDREGHVVERFTNNDDFRDIERRLNRVLHSDRRRRMKDKFDIPDMPDVRGDRPGRPDRPDRPPRRERPDRPDRPERPDRPDRPDLRDPKEREAERERRRRERKEEREKERERRRRDRPDRPPRRHDDL